MPSARTTTSTASFMILIIIDLILLLLLLLLPILLFSNINIIITSSSSIETIKILTFSKAGKKFQRTTYIFYFSKKTGFDISCNCLLIDISCKWSLVKFKFLETVR